MNDRTASAWAKLIAAVTAGIVSIIGALALAGVFDDDTSPRDPTPVVGERNLSTGAAAELDGKVDEKTADSNTAAPLRSTDVPGESKAEERATIKENEQTVERQAIEYDTTRVLDGAAAGPVNIFCHTPMNGGIRPISAIGLNVVHVTVSLNVIGLADINGLCAFFKRVKASPTWTVDNEGNTAENVPLNRVPWTQVIFNRAACSTEFVGSTGRPGQGPAQWTDVQLREGARLAAKCHALAGIPVRDAVVRQDGTIVRTGVITHQELGAAGGGHSDPGPFFNMDRYQGYIREYLKPPCDTRCRAVARQRAVVEGRDRKHKVTHDKMGELGCRKRIHSRAPSEYRREACRALKRRDVRQRRGELRARAELGSL
jgi:hypothetical protein